MHGCKVFVNKSVVLGDIGNCYIDIAIDPRLRSVALVPSTYL